MKKLIFVFGSNLAGRHGKGAALTAKRLYRAEYGVGVGRTGDAYAIPTKDYNLRSLPLKSIQKHVDDFILYAKENPDLRFNITRVGCGLAGYSDEQIGPMFANVPENCLIPDEWTKYINHEE
jgi:hypothetical protein